MNQRTKRGVGVLMLGAGIWLTTFGCGADDDEGPPTAGSHQGGSSTAGTAGRGGSAGSAAGGDTEHGGSAGGDTNPGGAAGSTVTGGMGGAGAGQGGTPEPSEAGQAGGGNTAAGDGGSASAGAPSNGQSGEQTTGRVDCGGQSCDRCCYELLYDQYPVPPSPEFECAPIDKPPLFCGIDYRFDMTCDAKSDCAEGRVCCMERTKISLLAHAYCESQCPVATSTTLHYELCANDEECTAPQHCVKLPNQYFRVCQ